MTDKNAAALAAAGIDRLVDAVNEHGLGSGPADAAAQTANVLRDAAHAVGATDDDIKNARR